VTNRNRGSSQIWDRSFQRVCLPLLLVAATVAAGGCFQRLTASDSPAGQPLAASGVRLGEEDGILDMRDLAGLVVDVPASTGIATTTITRWVKNTAQAILESDWGRSRLTRQANNLFGIKAPGSASGPAGVVTLTTWEHVGGGEVVVEAPFKAYYTLEQSIDDHGRFFTRNKRYADALSVADDAQAFARAIQDAGYATDPSYASKLIALMNRYDLYRFDG
jgi:hypothetical protein